MICAGVDRYADHDALIGRDFTDSLAEIEAIDIARHHVDDHDLGGRALQEVPCSFAGRDRHRRESHRDTLRAQARAVPRIADRDENRWTPKTHHAAAASVSATTSLMTVAS